MAITCNPTLTHAPHSKSLTRIIMVDSTVYRTDWTAITYPGTAGRCWGNIRARKGLLRRVRSYNCRLSTWSSWVLDDVRQKLPSILAYRNLKSSPLAFVATTRIYGVSDLCLLSVSSTLVRMCEQTCFHIWRSSSVLLLSLLWPRCYDFVNVDHTW